MKKEFKEPDAFTKFILGSIFVVCFSTFMIHHPWVATFLKTSLFLFGVCYWFFFVIRHR